MKTFKRQMMKQIRQATVCLYLLLTMLFLSMSMLHSETVDVYVGDPNSTEWSPIAPFTYDWENSLAQTIYTADELTEVGLISSIEYTYNSNSHTISGSNVAVYMANIWDDIDEFTTNTSWIPFENFTLVYDGELPYHPPGLNPLTLVLDNPFNYQGGTLVIYTWLKFRPTWPAGCPFLQTKDEDRFRTIHIVSMSDNLHPLSPPPGQLSNNVPNITITITPNDNIGHLSGVVTHNDVPLEGVRVIVNDSTRGILTDDFGQYALNRLSEGVISITVSKPGFFTQEIDNIIIIEGEITTLDISMESIVSVSGIVIAGDTGESIEGALVVLEVDIGNQRLSLWYETTTDDMGQFILEDIYPDIVYTLTITIDGYKDYVELNIEIGIEEIYLGNISLIEIPYPPQNVYAELFKDSVVVSWEAATPSPISMENGEWRMENIPLNKIGKNRVFESYKIYRFLEIDIDDENLWTILDTDVTELSYIDMTWLECINGKYIYAVKAVYTEENISEPAFSNVIEKEIELLPPTDFTASVDGSTVTLSWIKPESEPLGYGLYRGELPLHRSTVGRRSYLLLILETTYVDYEVPVGNHVYSLQAIYENGESEVVSIEVEIRVSDGDENEIPILTELVGNYPNPFNPSTTIRYNLSVESMVRIDIFNIRGQLVKTLVNEYQVIGRYTEVWHADDVPSGVYLYRLETSASVEVKRMVLMK